MEKGKGKVECGLPSNLYFVIRTQWNRKDSAGLIREALGEGGSPSRLRETLGRVPPELAYRVRLTSYTYRD